MKRTLLLLLTILSAKVLFAQKTFGINTSVGISAGVTQVLSPLKGDDFVEKSPLTLPSLDIDLAPVYVGFSGFYKNLDSDRKISSLEFRVGPSVAYHFLDRKIIFSPFFGRLYSILDYNVLGLDNSTVRSKSMLYGLRVGCSTKHFNMNVYGSNRDAGMTVGYIYDLRDLFRKR